MKYLKYLKLIDFSDLDLELEVAAEFEELAQLDHAANDQVVLLDEVASPRHGGSYLHLAQLKFCRTN